MIKAIGITGAGTMGTGIAQLAALAHFEVILHDVAADALHASMEKIKEQFRQAVRKGKLTPTEATEALSSIHPRRALSELGNVELIIEAAVEDLAVKKEIFRKLDTVASPDAILATNTSSLPVTEIGSLTKTPELVVGMHFFNPPTVMTLVEVVRGAQTSTATVAATCDVAMRMGRTPVVCKDTPGFIVNRVARPFYLEALRLLDEKVSTVQQIDAIVKREGGFTMGPFELMDLIGIDVNYAVTRSLYDQFHSEPRFRPSSTQQKMVEAGTLGRKTKKGFYAYP